MSRKARKYQTKKSLIFHVINRGILKQDIFHDEDDFSCFKSLLKKYSLKESLKIYHWCIMSNHYHVVLEISDPERISKVVGGWQQVYALRYHKKYNTAGKLFQGRFKSQAIDDGRYLLACGRYVEQNPIRAGVCRNLDDWKWSSANFYIKNKTDGLTSQNPYFNFSQDKSYDYSEELESLFKSSADIIGSKEFSSQLIKVEGRPAKRKRGRRPELII